MLMGASIMLFVLVVQPANGDEAAPLAQCRLQTIAGSEQSEMRNGQGLMAVRRPVNIIATNYRRGSSGDWDVPGEVSGDDPHVRLLLLTPDGPLCVLLSISVNGQSFRATRERWIDDALNGNAVTEEPVATVDQPASDEVEGTVAAPNESEETDGVSPQTFRPAAALSRLQKYAGQPGIDVGRDEARWLLAQWSPGPTLLELRANFAMDRAQVAPLWAALDQNGDGKLSADEVTSAKARLRSLDDDEDDWVDESELAESPLIQSWTTFPLATVLQDTTDWGRLAALLRITCRNTAGEHLVLTKQLLTRLGVAELSQLSAQDLSRLLETTPQVKLRIDFGTQSDHETGLFMTELAEEVASQSEPVSAVEDRVSLNLARSTIELSAAQQSKSEDWNGQVAVGAVIDGSPLLRRVDLDNDRRLSQREIESVPSLLEAIDRNKDGIVMLDEVPVPIRLVLTLGPHAHTVLERQSVAPAITTPADAPAAPPWFASMDLNRDGDLTPAEFLGTREQFDALDLDQNQRVSTAEAAHSAE